MGLMGNEKKVSFPLAVVVFAVGIRANSNFDNRILHIPYVIILDTSLIYIAHCRKIITMDVDEALINEVRERSSLFDLASPHYKNVGQRDLMWEEIGKCLKLDGDICRKKWKLLRDNYRRTKRAQLLVSGSAAPSHRVKKWRHYDAMKFLNEVRTSRKTVGSLEEDSPLPFELQTEAVPTSTPPSSTPLSTSARASPRPRLSAAINHRQLQDDFSGFMQQLSESAKNISENFVAGREEGRVEIAFSGMAKIIKAENMPENLETSVINEVQTFVFSAVENCNSRDIERN